MGNGSGKTGGETFRMIGADWKKLRASCLILAGGKGKRLTPDKPLLKIDQKPIIQRVASVAVDLFEEVLVVTNTPGKYGFLHLPLVADERTGCGPLMGVYSGLQKIENDVAFVCAADMPFLDETVIRPLYRECDGFDIVVPCPRRRPEFLHAFYTKGCLDAMRENLDADQFKIEMLTRRCKTLRLTSEWFARNGLMDRMDLAFANINTLEDYHYCLKEATAGRKSEKEFSRKPPGTPNGPDALESVAPGVLQEIRRTLIQQESAYQQKSAEETFSSLWTHSARVGRIAYRIAKAEGWPAEPALLAGLLHDTGKFFQGSYHEDDVLEEQNAVRCVERVLSGTVYQKWIPIINDAILCTYLEGEAMSDIARAVYDADCLDKLGNMGVAQFFAKRALRRQFLDDDVLIRASVELTYARHAPDTLKTATGRSLALKRSIRTPRFYRELLEEWAELGIGAYDIFEEDIAGIVCILVVPRACPCGERLKVESDIHDAVKCRSVVVTYRCRDCGSESGFSFCLPNVRGLPRR
jgi:molybdopterin-guanine dinucleotide biosynthesis protein A/HD superfamily phosphodiesterase